MSSTPTHHHQPRPMSIISRLLVFALSTFLVFLAYFYTTIRNPPHHVAQLSLYRSTIPSNPTLPSLSHNYPHFEHHPAEISELVIQCVNSRRSDLLFEDTADECSIYDSIPVLTTINPKDHNACMQLQRILNEEYILCSYDSTHCIHKANIKQPIGFIKLLYQQYFYDNMQHYIHKMIQKQSTHRDFDRHHDLSNQQASSTHLISSPRPRPALIIPTLDHVPTTNTTLTQDESFRQSQILHYYAKLHFPLFEQHIESIRAIFGIYAKCGIKHIDSIYAKAYRSQILKNEPWYNVLYIRDALRAKVRINSFHQIKPILALLSSYGYHILQADYNKFFEPKIWGWRPIAIDLRYYLNPNDIAHIFTPHQQQQLQQTLQHLNDLKRHNDPATSHDHPPSIHDLLKNTGFIIELYFVPSDMDYKVVKSHNHHIYEKWRNLPIVPTFQDYYEQHYTDSKSMVELTGCTKANVTAIHSQQQQQQQQHLKTSSQPQIPAATTANSTHSAPISASDHDHEIEEVIEKEQKKLHDIDFCRHHFYSFIPLTHAEDDLYSMWIEFLNDVFWSSYSYTIALERWAQHSFSHNDQPAPQSVSSLEQSFQQYISHNLLKCYPECEQLWKQRTEFDHLSYPSSTGYQHHNTCISPTQ